MSEKNQIIYIEMTQSKFREELEKASTIGAMKAMALCGVSAKEMLTRAELSRRFGRGKINRLIEANELVPCNKGARPMYKLSDVLTII